MTTSRQIEANKQNALLSTGATTLEGKKAVSKNAIRHGIFTATLVIGDGMEQESLSEYQELLQNIKEGLKPTDQIESLLVEKIAVDFWRLRRVIQFESHCISDDRYGMLKPMYTIPYDSDSERITRYERSLHRSIMQNLAMLKKLQGVW